MKTVEGIRVGELAEELDMTVAELVTTLKDLGIDAPRPTSVLDTETATTVREMLRPTPVRPKDIEVAADATVKDVADAMGVSPTDAVKKLMKLGQLIAANQRIPAPLMEKLAAEFGFDLKVRAPEKPAKQVGRRQAAPGAVARPPVVTIMGHVDHGKTTLLDTIRKANVVAGEHGGITQHIGAYQVEVESGGEAKRITFLDTPGHAAFTAMRARGASVTDIVVLVVAADDGIMPQTIEAISHAQAADVPIIVAINKIDRPDANPDRIKQQLTEHGLVVEDYGGDVIAVPVSAVTGEGVDLLLQNIIVLAEVLEVKADPNVVADGVVIEARVETGRGAVTNMLVQNGTLRIGDAVVAGAAFGRVRAMTNDRGERLQKAGPSTPIEVLGLNVPPLAGDRVAVYPNEKDARQTAERNADSERQGKLATPQRATLADLMTPGDGSVKQLNVVLKADVQGSVEAVVGQLKGLVQRSADDSEEVRLSIKLSGVGSVGVSDVQLAEATNSVIIGFNVRADGAAQKEAGRGGVDIRLYNIIYDLTEDTERLLRGMLEPVFEEVALGKAEVRQSFRTPRGVHIGGCFVTEGKLVRGAQIRVKRQGDVLLTSRLDSLRHIKEDVREMAQGFECGVVIDNWTEPYQPGDVFECFELKEITAA